MKKKGRFNRKMIGAAATLVLSGLAACQLFASWLYDSYFGHRVSSEQSLLKCSLDDYPDLSREGVSFFSGKNMLKGYFYINDNADQNGTLVVISHGIGCGHIDYLSHIEYLTAAGFTVFAFDNTGCNESEGEGMYGLAQSVIDLHNALIFLENDPETQKMPTVLYGHSWGGYAVCAVLGYGHNVEAVVSLSGFNKTHDMIMEMGASLYGEWVKLFSPFIDIYEAVKFGNAGRLTSQDGIEGSDIPVLLIHDKSDNIVSYANGVCSVFSDSDDDRISKMILKDRFHDALLSDDAITYMRSLIALYSSVCGRYGGFENVPPSVVEAYLSQVDVMRAKQLDPSLCGAVVDFINDSLASSVSKKEND